MASRKTDFNTEDIMGSLLGMDRQEKEDKEKEDREKEEPSEKEASREIFREQVRETPSAKVSIPEKRDIVPYDTERESEYIPIDNIRIRRRDEKDMKVPVSFSLSRKTAEQLKQIAYVERLSSSEIVSGLIEAYINAHQEILTEYRELLNRRK